MKRILLGVLLPLFGTAAFSQTFDLADRGCATVTTPEELQAVYDYVALAPNLKTTAGTDTIPLSIHIVGNDAGLGYYSLSTLWKVICNTNARFQPAGIYFHVEWPIRYINSSTYYTHNFQDGYSMMQQYNVPNTVNVYFVSDPAGACGYFSPGADGVAIAMSCGGFNSTTLTHELGHFLGLPHTFSGWENNAIPSNPELVTRGAGANCSSRGDGFCDTDADYLGYRWQCPYSGVKYDANNDLYHPDSSLYMSYSTDACMTRFSPQQIGRMQFRLANNRANLLAYNSQPYTALDTPSLAYPSDSMYSNDRTIRWQAVPSAQYYHVIVTRTAGSILIKDTLTNATSLTLTQSLVDFNRYTVKITPLASSNVCAVKTRSSNFSFSPSASPLGIGGAASTSAGSIEVYPNPANSNGWTLQIPDAPRGALSVAIVTPAGATVRRQETTHAGGFFQTTIPATDLASGLYFIRITASSMQWTGRALLQR